LSFASTDIHANATWVWLFLSEFQAASVRLSW
jgi:hypothetical protein